MENGVSRQRFSWISAGLVGFVALSFFASTTEAAQVIRKTGEHVPGELVIKLRDSRPGPGAFSAVFSALEQRLGTSVVSVKPLKTDRSTLTVRLDHAKQVGSALRVLEDESVVLYAEPNYIYRALETGRPNDPDFNQLWGMNNVGQADSAGQIGTPGADIRILPLWQQGITGSKNVVVAVIDTGIDWNHPDLAANIYTNPGEAGELATNGKDDDGNGFIDDVHGWDFSANDNQPMDDNMHGSHCAGTIGGVGNNGVGVTGVNWNVSMMPVKFLTKEGGGTLASAIESINYARKMKVNLMSNSWGGGSFSQQLLDAIKATRDAGILFVAAAGNEANNNDRNASYPASYDLENIISVAATDNKDQLARFSNFGGKTVHVAAPGVKVYSTTPDGKYASVSGTSMACPHVSGIAALLLSVHPEWTFTEIKNRLIQTSDPVEGLFRKVVANGRVNAYNAFHGIVPPKPAEPDESLWRDVSYSVESEHPYKNNMNEVFTVKVPGAKFIRVIFDEIAVEQSYDRVLVENAAGAVMDDITGKAKNYAAWYIVGDTAVIRLKSDGSETDYGFKVSRIQVIYNE